MIRKLGYLENGTGQHQSNTVYGIDGQIPAITTIQGGGTQQIKILTNTKKGFTPLKNGGVADLSYPSSKTRRGRVQGNGELSPTLTTTNQDICKVERSETMSDTRYRIRKLTPLECWRLMGFSDEEFMAAEKVNSNTQLYKQAGNSIVVNVLEEIFKKVFETLESREQMPKYTQMNIEDWLGR